MNKIFTSIVLWFSIALSQGGQTTFIPLSVDYALFRGAEEQIYLEIYISFLEGHLQYSPSENIFQAEYLATAEISQNDSVLFRQFDRRRSEIDSLSDVSVKRKFINIFKFSLNPGHFAATVTIQDLSSTRKGEYFFEFDASGFAEQELDMSDIQLCSKITPDTTQNDFQKNSLLAVPNPESIYSISQPVLYYYAEVYNFEYFQNKEGYYSYQCTIKDSQGEIVKQYPEKTIRKPGNSAVIVGGHNIVTLDNDTYFINLEIEDLQTQKSVSASKRFNFIKPSRKIIVSSDSAGLGTEVNYNLAEYLQYSEEQLNQEFEQLQYLTTPEQKSVFKNLDIESKRFFLAKFWYKFDKTPETEINEFKTHYLQMIEYANLNFGSMNKAGWKTDRGRILLTYGVPDEVERNYMAIDMKPHEIWHYYEFEGGVLFVFADLTGFGEFDLVHSTYSRELYQPDWERLVRKTQGGTGFDTKAK